MSSFPTPMLDDRKFQQIVDEVRKRIPLYCPEWTDHNVSDPGITLIELFASMIEVLLYRLNQVPELHFIKFMEFLGIERQPPSAAQTLVTFYLTKSLTLETDPDNQGMVIAGDTKVSTTQTETAPPIIFTIEEAFTIYPPRLHAVALERRQAEQTGGVQPQSLPIGEVQNLQTGTSSLAVFADKPEEQNAIWFGFVNDEHDLSYHVLSLKLKFDDKVGIGININQPPYVWEAYTMRGDWVVVDVEKDTTKGMNVLGEVILHLPALGKLALESGTPFQAPQGCHWVRARVKEPSVEEIQQGMRKYRESPRLLQIVLVATVGGAAIATHVDVQKKELLGVSDGSAGQHFFVDSVPIMAPRRPDEQLRVQVDEDKESTEDLWQEAPHANFASSQPDDKHYVLNSISGELRFGPAVRQPKGDIRRYGATPPRGARLILERYRTGGGVKGNLQRKMLNTLKTSIPYVERVENRIPATGGMDAQSLEAVKMSAQWLLRNRHLAFTPDDYVARVLEKFGKQIARVHCLPLTITPPDTAVAKAVVRILLIPQIFEPNSLQLQGYLDNRWLYVADVTRDEIATHLENYRMLTVQLRVENAIYRRVGVQVKCTLKGRAQQAAMKKNIERCLYTYLNPLIGGHQATGWPFGQAVTTIDLLKHLQNLPDITSQTALELTLQDMTKGENNLSEVALEPDETVVSGRHQIEFVQ